MVADVSGNRLILTIGSARGLHVGDTLTLSRPMRTIKDPATGHVLRQLDTSLGIVTITGIDLNSATATYSGPQVPQVGDTVKLAAPATQAPL